MNRDLKILAQVFKALADPTRVRIVGLLLGGEVCVCHIHDALGIPQPKTSRHLAYLRRAGLVETEKRGLWVYYRLAPQRDEITRALVDGATHCIGHLSDVRKDGAKLEKQTGCCVPLPGAVTLDCCGVSTDRPARGGRAEARTLQKGSNSHVD